MRRLLETQRLLYSAIVLLKPPRSVKVWDYPDQTRSRFAETIENRVRRQRVCDEILVVDGVHHVTLKGMVEALDKNAYAFIELHPDYLREIGVGTAARGKNTHDLVRILSIER